ncbi:hypothetical protein BH11PSE11_BH11PSE11_20330 [soil metagenome]
MQIHRAGTRRDRDMTTRRRFLQTMAMLPPSLSFGAAWAAPISEIVDPSRLALVIGNSDYRQAPLANPVNDARAMAGLFGQAGFTVDSRTNATRDEMMAAFERFGDAIRRPEIKLVAFYYAGHGLQLDWRNYLVPVGAEVATAEQLKQRSVDLNQMLVQLGKVRDKTFIIILDACRNNPFGTSYRTEQKGLSQFDAPAGSLLAYATSPGSVASDGDGINGLYTENLVRELSVRSARIEDALKKVRLNVRLLSRGAQIPWETTSLESDVFIFNEERPKLSAAELEKLLEDELAEWARIKTSSKAADWINYLRNFPNGRFGEIAQLRLARLLQEVERRSDAFVAAVPAGIGAGAPKAGPLLPAAETAMPVLPAIVLEKGGAWPQLLQPSANPYSAGVYRLARIFTVGDEVVFRESDLVANVQSVIISRVTKVDLEAGRVEFEDGKLISDLMGNLMKYPGVETDIPIQYAPLELQIGKKWRAAYRQSRGGVSSSIYYDFQVARREILDSELGAIDCFKVEGEGRINNTGAVLRAQLWMVPGLNASLRREYEVWSRGKKVEHKRYDLVSMRQQVFDMSATPGGGPNRALVIKGV